MPGDHAFNYITFISSTLEAAKITDIEKVELKFHVFSDLVPLFDTEIISILN